MKRIIFLASIATLLASCTALIEKDAFLDSLPRPSNVVFSDDFESGLGKWNIGNGSWITSTPGSGGLAMQSPTSTGIATFSIATASIIDLAGKTGCILEYDTRYLLKGVSGVSANVLFGTQKVGTLKDTTGLSDISSATAFVHRKAALPTNGSGRVSFVTTVTNDTTGYADLRVDNVVVSCNGTTSAATTLVDENFEVSAANWSLQSPWALNAGSGVGGSTSLNAPWNGGATFTSFATYSPTINLTNRSGCLLTYYYGYNSNDGAGSMSLEWNSKTIWAKTAGATITGNVDIYLTAFEDTATNSLQFRCLDANWLTGGVQCTIDQVKLTCQQ
ncbi:MAG: hypothetical protein JNJ69_14115 [Leptospiraceae bacterium]|nr:hypothetical protein [Leptospiraceae bacterium]